ncbi:leucyl/phenylalanyl-tRNA--protein transferase [Porphyrobacter sp. CACIAM 03H1]|uniref:leucyl/phenylalanyl-tRNA--protein transferase n=1 Tax=Porphyrobacter sp. CACIAM 03H1 TaxID=2003315 RepID=UPI000B5A659B|nr:leucyl/phenylalanyl-tRNA--protein transferase [Porphyrobacter sp. CACIAM 03H1]ASJ90199.1 leucyl/phenylalanyl-tRNA--protein transferase [Porphyrobacter sp. CACIAM 03H1]
MHAPSRPPIPVETLLLAYRSGIFPMADRREDPEVFWVEPRERAIIPLEGLHLSKSLKKVIRADRFTVTVDRAFEQVIRACAEPRPDHPETWISERIVQSYLGLHRAGHAHSVECWQEGAGGEPELVGGLYGVSFDRVFCGESMFSRVPDASKVALAWLVALMRRAGMVLLDCQFMTEHLRSMGARELSQADYRRLVERAQGQPPASLGMAWRAFAGGYVAGGAGAGTAGAGAAGVAAAEGEAEAPAAGRPEASALGEAGPSSPGKLIVQSLTQTS